MKISGREVASILNLRREVAHSKKLYLLCRYGFLGIANKTAWPVPNFHVQVSVSDLIIPRSVHLFGSQTHACRNWERGRSVSFLGIFVSNFGTVSFQFDATKVLKIACFQESVYTVCIVLHRVKRRMKEGRRLSIV
jgi:hypothetical protein